MFMLFGLNTIQNDKMALSVIRVVYAAVTSTFLSNILYMRIITIFNLIRWL